MRRVLVVIDMQNDFITGPLGTAEAAAIVPAVVQKVCGYAAADIYATRDTHGADYLQTQEGRLLPVEHCLRGTPGWQLAPELAPLIPPEHIVDKPSFGSPELAALLTAEHARQPLEIELVGLCTDICVVSNALLLKAALPEVPVSVDASCCAGVTPAKHAAALETMRSCQVLVH